ncbi:MAG: hypothetical protein M0Q29_07370 [Thiopseudomonas sp.]|nr:hypothetical protein [Thiopseudomonas sp.]
MEYFEIAFAGQIVLGAELEQAKQGVQRLFNANEQLMEQFFSGRRVVIKQKVDQATALKYQKAFAAAGAILEVQKIESDSVAPVATPAATPAPSASSGAEVVPRDAYMAAFTHVQAPDFAIAPVGTDIVEHQEHQEQPELDVDISAMSLAPVGSDMGHQPAPQDVLVPDISHIKLAD